MGHCPVDDPRDQEKSEDWGIRSVGAAAIVVRAADSCGV